VIIARYLVKEVFTTLMGVMVVLLLIALSAQLVGLFSQVTSGALNVDTVMLVFGLKTITILVFIIPLSLFLAILLAFGRLYRESEMVAIAACGTGPAYVLRSVLGLALIVAVIQAVLSMQLAPWAEAQIQRLSVAAQNSTDIQGIIAGRFKEMSEGVGVVYVEELNDSKDRMQNVFVEQQRDQGQSIVSASSGYQYLDKKNGDRFMVLQDGYRYEGEPGKDNYTVIQFEKHGIRIRKKEAKVIHRRNYTIATTELWRDSKPSYIAELQWRISSVLMCLVLAVLAVPLSVSSHRRSNYGKLAVAIALYVVFTNLLTVSRDMVHKEQISPYLGLWWVHLVMIALAVALLLRQTGVRHLFRKTVVTE
jgi:lipopolysaccharide export system permease protein